MVAHKDDHQQGHCPGRRGDHGGEAAYEGDGYGDDEAGVKAYFIVCETGEYRPGRRRKRPQTIRADRYLYKKYLVPLASIRVEALTRGAVRKLLRDLLAAGEA